MPNNKDQIEKARNLITNVVNTYCIKYNYEYNRIAIKNQRSRLGSCSSRKNLNFNWQIIKFPQEVMEYVVLHELAHLVHQNHSKEYWKEVEKLDPGYKIHHTWIKSHGHKLIKF